MRRGAFKDVDVLITMLPNGKVVRDVLLGDEGVVRGLRPGADIYLSGLRFMNWYLDAEQCIYVYRNRHRRHQLLLLFRHPLPRRRAKETFNRSSRLAHNANAPPRHRRRRRNPHDRLGLPLRDLQSAPRAEGDEQVHVCDGRLGRRTCDEDAE